MPPFKDLTGQSFARLTVIERVPSTGRVLWRCRCACGNDTLLSGDRLVSGQTQSCGCWRREQSRKRREKPKPQPGERFGRLTILEFIGDVDSKHPNVRCRCDCGRECTPQWGNVRTGATASCGCIKVEMLKAKATHGMSSSPEYKAWSDIRERCYRVSRKDFKRYGAKGITVCQRWLESFENFYADMGAKPSRKHSIDRIENEKGYEPSNCRWATAMIQRENQRRTVLFTFNGHTGTLKDLARRAGISYSAVHQRVNTLKWSIEKALTTPLRG